MARTKNGKLTGRAAATELAEAQSARLEALIPREVDILREARVSIKVARSLLLRDNWNWPNMIEQGFDLFADTLAQLVDLVNTDPQHRRVGG